MLAEPGCDDVTTARRRGFCLRSKSIIARAASSACASAVGHEPELSLLLNKLKLELPAQPPPKITAIAPAPPTPL